MSHTEWIQIMGAATTTAAVMVSTALQRRWMRALRREMRQLFEEIHQDMQRLRRDLAKIRLT